MPFMRAKQSLGQNFLMHRQTAERIVIASGVSPDDTVLEIGPGTGMLTRALLARCKRVIAAEADHSLVEALQETFATEIKHGRLTLLHEDIRHFDPKSIESRYSVVANIPYYITGEIIRQFLTAEHQPASMTLLVQKEVAERIARSKKESLLSLSVKAYGAPIYRFLVPRGAFRPAPNVDSAVLHIEGIDRASFADSAHERRFFEVLHAGFAHKRKQLGKNLEEIAPRESVQAALQTCSILPTVRAEDLSLTTWLALASVL